MQIKRLWDTDNKKVVFTEWPTGHKCQVWTGVDGNLYIYDMAQWLTYNGTSTEWEEYVRSNRVALTDQVVGYYDTDEPTELYNRDHGDEAYYQFVDYDGTVLKSWTVDEWTAPTPPADPTREATAQYTYTFAGWNPTVWKISKRTTYTATYTATVNKYTITFVDEDWTTELDSQELDYWATPVYAWETPTKAATAQYTYTFSWWTPEIATVTADATYTATYSSEVNQYTVSIAPNDESYGTVDESSIDVDYGTTISASSNVLTLGEEEITATAEEGYAFSEWTDSNGDPLPATVTWTLGIVAVFTSNL